MNDVEGIRNLVGTGLVELVGGLLTAAIAFVVMLRISPLMTVLTLVALAASSRLVLAGRSAPPSDLPRARQDQRRGHRAAHRVARRGAGREGLPRRGAGGGGLRGRRGAPPRQRPEDADRDVRAGLSSTVLLGIVGAGVMFVGARQILAGRMTLGGFFTYTVFLGFLVAPVLPDRGDRHPAHRGARRARAHPRGPARAARGRGPAARRWRSSGLKGESRSRTWASPTRGRAGAPRRAAARRAGHGDRARRAVGGGQVHDHRPRLRLPRADSRARPRRRRRPRDRPARLLPRATSASCSRRPSCSTARSARTWPSRARRRARRRSGQACRIAHVDEFAETLRGGLRHGGGRARRAPLGRAAPAGLDRARDPGRPADPDPRRGHLEPRLGVGGAHPGGALLADEGAHHVRDRAPPVDHPARRPDPGDREGAHRRAGDARAAPRARRVATARCTTASTGVEANLFLAPGEGDEAAAEAGEVATKAARPGAGPRLGLLDP